MAPRAIPILAMAALLCSVAHAQPRPERMVLPLAPVLNHPETQRVLAGMPVRFGAPQGAVRPAPGTEVRALSWARPTDTRGFGQRNVPVGPDGRTVRLSDMQTCQLALRYTLAELVEEARRRGAPSVVEVVSINNEVEMNSATSFECIPGAASSVVTLRGRIGGASPAVAQPAAPMAPAPQMAAAPAAQPVVQPPSQPPMIASGFAAINDVDAIPYLSGKGREGYRTWLTWDTPRAFAISDTGSWASTTGLKARDPSHPSDPSERAILICQSRSASPCRLYAINGSVVWRK